MARLPLAATVLVAATAWPALALNGRLQDAGAYCTADGAVCAPRALEHVDLSNPLTFDVTVNVPDAIHTSEIHLSWQLRDALGHDLGKSPVWAYDRRTSDGHFGPATFHVRDFVLAPAGVPAGTLILSADCFDAHGKWSTLARLSVPVPLSRATTTVSAVSVKDFQVLWQATDAWMASGQTSKLHPLDRFDPRISLDRRDLTVMRLAPGALIGATAEAAITPNQGDWHVENWSQTGPVARVMLNGETWAGYSTWLYATEYLIRQSILRLPGIHDCIVETAKSDSSSHLDHPKSMRWPPDDYVAGFDFPLPVFKPSSLRE